MKKLLLIAAAGMLLASCKKDYSCECSVTTKTSANGTTVTTGPVTETTPLGKLKESEAQEKCLAMDGQTSTGTVGSGVVVDSICELK